MSDKPVCDRCESEDVVLGKLRGYTGLSFEPLDAQKHIPAEVRGLLCMACGDLRLVGDRRSVAKSLGRFVPGYP